MKVRRILSKTDKKKCSDLVNLNYNLDLLWYSKKTTEYVGLFDGRKLISFLGFCQSPMDHSYHEVFAVNTHPDFKRKGYATILFKELHKQILSQRKEVKMILTCDIFIESFYLKLGYKRIAKTKNNLIMYYYDGH